MMPASLGDSLVEEAANDNQSIRPQVGKGEGVELAPNAHARAQLSQEPQREAHHCTAMTNSESFARAQFALSPPDE